jgi:pimeloyl-ACP methyl ester carboxylesterase
MRRLVVLGLLAGALAVTALAVRGRDEGDGAPARAPLPGGRIAFGSTDGGVWVMRPDGSDRRRLFKARAAAGGGPRWSPDGRLLAFTIRAGPSEPGAPAAAGEPDTLATIDVATRRVRELVARVALADVTWAPDGRRLMFSVQGALFTVEPDGAHVLPFAQGTCPTFSPRGDVTVVCRQNPHSPNGTLVVALDDRGRKLRMLFRSPDFAVPGGFSPDGSRLVVSSGPESQSDVYVIDVATGRARLLLRKAGSQNVEGWLPDGRMVLADTDAITQRTSWRLLDPRDRSLETLPGFKGVGDPVDWWSPGRPVVERWAAGRRGPVLGMRNIRVAGRRLYYRCAGHGQPTVLLDSGLGVRSETWTRVQAAVARFTRVCRYDRAGNGLSDPAPGPRDSRDAVADLMALVRRARLGRSIVGVGASFGGLDMQLLAATRPRLLAGLVLVDSLHPQLDRRIEPLLPRAERLQRRQDLGRNSEGLRFADIVRSEAQVERAEHGRKLAVRTIVLRHGLPFEGGANFPSARVEALWTDLQRDLAARSRHGAVIVATRSHHRIAESQPALVSAAIRRLVVRARARYGAGASRR